MEFQQFYSCVPCALVFVFKWTIGTYDVEKLDTRYCLCSTECKLPFPSHMLEFVLYLLLLRITMEKRSDGGREGETGRKGGGIMTM